MDNYEPTRITLTVISGRNFHGRKKGDLSVVFGLGKDLYQTETVQSTTPYWNQEAHVNVTGKAGDSLVFKVKDQGHTFGILKVPIKSITRRKREEWHAIQPYKKEKECQGEICLSCFVSEFQPLSHPDKGGAVPVTSPTDERIITDKKNKTLLSSGGAQGNKVSPLFSENRKNTSNDLGKGINDSSTIVVSDEDNALIPEVTGISPNEGTIEGNERVILRGTNLGQNKDDVVKVTIANVDCTSSLEYFSSGKLVVTTLPRKTPSKGPVIIETNSGGIGISSLHYSYVAPAPPTDHLVPSANNDTTVGSSSSSVNSATPSPIIQTTKKIKLSEQDICELQSENRFMKQQLKELNESNRILHENNTALKEYVEHLLSTILEHNPNLLEIVQQNNPSSLTATSTTE